MKAIAGCLGLAAIIALAGLAAPAQAAPAATAPPTATPAAAPVFPIGSHIGLVPPPGMELSNTFTGFVDPKTHAAILIAVLPAAAYADMVKTLTPELLKKQGVTLATHETIKLGFTTGTLVMGTQTASDKTRYRKWMLLAPTSEFTAVVTAQVPEHSSAYSDSMMHAALASLALRSVVPESEFLKLLPFTIGNFAGFHLANIVPGRAALLIDAPPYPHMVVTDGLPAYEFDGRAMIAVVPGGPNDQESKSDFARLAFNTIGGIKNRQLTMAEPVRLDEQDGFETVAHAQDASTGADLMVVQWLRFGNGATLQIVGISRAEIWDRELKRLLTLRDSIRIK